MNVTKRKKGKIGKNWKRLEKRNRYDLLQSAQTEELGESIIKEKQKKRSCLKESDDEKFKLTNRQVVKSNFIIK